MTNDETLKFLSLVMTVNANSYDDTWTINSTFPWTIIKHQKDNADQDS